MKFQVGDKVEWCGVHGEITKISDSNYPITVQLYFNSKRDEFNFTKEGKYFAWHAQPSLVLVERPKAKVKKVKKVFYSAILHDSSIGPRLSPYLCQGIEEARRIFGVDCVIGLGPAIEVEVDE